MTCTSDSQRPPHRSGGRRGCAERHSAQRRARRRNRRARQDQGGQRRPRFWTRQGSRLRSGADRYSCASARAGPGLQGNHRHRHSGGRRGRIHRRGRDAQHHAGERLAGDHALDAGARAWRGGARVSHCGGHARIEGRNDQRFRRAEISRRRGRDRRRASHPERQRHARDARRRGPRGAQRDPARRRYAA